MGINLNSDTFFSKKFLIPLGIVGVIAVIIIIISLSGRQKSPMEDVFQLNLRLSNLSKTVTTYKDSLKSPSLRNASTTFTNIIASTTSSLSPLLGSEEYKKLNKDITKDITSSEEKISTELSTTLENARLNATLDTTFATAMSTQIFNLIQLEQTTKSSTTDTNLQSALTSSIDNLNTIYPDFNNFTP